MRVLPARARPVVVLTQHRPVVQLFGVQPCATREDLRRFAFCFSGEASISARLPVLRSPAPARCADFLHPVATGTGIFQVVAQIDCDVAAVKPMRSLIAGIPRLADAKSRPYCQCACSSPSAAAVPPSANIVKRVNARTGQPVVEATWRACPSGRYARRCTCPVPADQSVSSARRIKNALLCRIGKSVITGRSGWSSDSPSAVAYRRSQFSPYSRP